MLLLSALGAFSLAFGYKSFGDLEAGIDQRSSALEAKTAQRFDALETKTAQRFDGLEAKLTQEIKAKADLEIFDISLDIMYSEYRRMFYSVMLDEIDEKFLSQLDNLQKEVKRLEQHGSGQDPKLVEIKNVIHAVMDAREEDYDHGIADLASVSKESPVRNRILASLLSKRFSKYLKAGYRTRAADDLKDLKDAAQRYYDAEGNISPLANVIKATSALREAQYAVVESEQIEKYSEEKKYLERAKSLDYSKSYVDYDLAACLTRLGKLGEAITELKYAQEKGDLRKKEQLDFFAADDAFEPLRRSTEPEIKDNLFKITHPEFALPG